MAEENTEQATTETTTEPQAESKPDTGTGADLTAEVEKWKALARKHEDKAKTNADAAKRLAEIEESSKSELQKAIEAARKEGASEGAKAFAPKLVAAEFKAAAAGRMTAEQLSGFLEDLDLSKYLTEDGEVDIERVAKKVDLLAPPAEPQTPSFQGGPRQTEKKRAQSLGEAIADRMASKP